MNSIQESTNELNAAIRYAENAIASANQTIESMQFRQDMAKKQYTEQTGREQALEDENERLKRDVEFYTKEYNDLAERLKMEIAALERIRGENYQLQDKLAEDIPNMPTIPKDVAIAIFREGVAHGVSNACYELDNSDSIEIHDSECMGNFEVEYTQYVDLSDHIDLDWLRSEVGVNDEADVIIALRGLCETKGFECRIHGIDEKKTPKIQ